MNIREYHDNDTVTITNTIHVDQESVSRDIIEDSQQLTKSFFIVSGFKVKSMYQLANKYWPMHYDYFYIRESNPWWLVETEIGLITIGPRKRVTSIDWEPTGLKIIVTPRDVTKGETYVHCYDNNEIIECLQNLRLHASEFD